MPALTLRRRTLFPILLSTAVLSACGGGAAERDEFAHPELLQEHQRLDETARAAVASGLVGAVFASQHQSTERLYLGKAGRKKQQDGAALAGDEAFQLASLSKSMTAALAAEQVRLGRLRWDSRPAELLPELSAVLHPAYAQVTLAQLLDHRSGLPALQDPAELADLQAFLVQRAQPLPGTDRERRRLLAQWLMARAPEARPGLDLHYSNAGYTVAGAMLEAASGQDFETLLRTWARGLGLEPQWQASARAAQGHEGESPSTLSAYTPLSAEWQVWLDALKPSGDVWLSPGGYGRWLAEHQRARQGQRHGLAPDYVQRLRQLGEGDYALGWAGAQHQGQRALVHSGAYHGFMGLVWLQQDGKKAYFALSNTQGLRVDGSSWVMDALNSGLLHLLSR